MYGGGQLEVVGFFDQLCCFDQVFVEEIVQGFDVVVGGVDVDVQLFQCGQYVEIVFGFGLVIGYFFDGVYQCLVVWVELQCVFVEIGVMGYVQYLQYVG